MDRPWIDAGLKYATIKVDDLPSLLVQRVARLRGAKALRTTFLRYLVGSRSFTDHVLGVQTGTAVPHISGSQIKAYKFALPLLTEQDQIAEVLASLDDKIELNRRMNETLERMAQAMFRDWFVDFGPVRRKLEGATDPVKIMGDLVQNADEAARLAALFPAALADTGLPNGWRYSTIGQEVTTLLGGTPSRAREDFWNGNIPWINSGKANEFRVTEPSERITALGLGSSATKLLPRRTTVIAITGATLGQVSLTEIETCANQSIVGVIGDARTPSSFIFYWIKENIDALVAKQTGGAQQHINRGNVDELPIVLTDKDVVSAYDRLVSPALDRIALSCFENTSLAATRDLLLPKLMSGEIRLKDAGKIAEAAE